MSKFHAPVRSPQAQLKPKSSGKCDTCGWDFGIKHYETSDREAGRERIIYRDEMRAPRYENGQVVSIHTLCGDCYEKQLWRRGLHTKQAVGDGGELAQRAEKLYSESLFCVERHVLTEDQRAENRAKIEKSIQMLAKKFGVQHQ